MHNQQVGGIQQSPSVLNRHSEVKTYLAKGGMQEGGDLKSMGNVDVEPLLLFYRLDGVDGRAGAFDEQLVVAFLVNGVVAFLALIALHAKTPQKFVAEGTEGGLSEKFGDKLVALKRVDLRNRKGREEVYET